MDNNNLIPQKIDVFSQKIKENSLPQKTEKVDAQDTIPANYLFAVMLAISYSISVNQEQQFADAKTTETCVSMQQKTMDQEKAQIDDILNKGWTDKNGNHQEGLLQLLAELAEKKGDDGTLKTLVEEGQALVQQKTLEQQNANQCADETTQTARNQDAQDVSTQERKIELATAMNQILQALASVLGRAA